MSPTNTHPKCRGCQSYGRGDVLCVQCSRNGGRLDYYYNESADRADTGEAVDTGDDSILDMLRGIMGLGTTECPECGTPLVNGRCPSPAKHNGGVE
jgi:hypothetical protein